MDKQCLFHSGMQAQDEELCRRCDKVEAENKEQWAAIGTKAGSPFLMWAFGIMIVVLLSVFGGLWRSQVGMENKIIGVVNSHNETNIRKQEDINTKIGNIRTDITVMQTNFENYTKTGKWIQRRNHVEEKKER